MADRVVAPRALARGLLLGATLVGLAWAAERLAAAGILSPAWIDAEVAGHGWRGYAAFFAGGTLATALGFPRQVVAFLGGYAFGAWVGSELALAATFAGCLASFAYARVFARAVVTRHFAGRVRQVDEFLNAAPFHMTLIVRLLPVGSNLVTNLVAGVTSVRTAAFLAGSALGYLPQTLAFAFAGTGLQAAPALNFVLAAVLFIASAVVGIRWYRMRRRGTSLESEIDAALDHLPPGTPAGAP